MLRDKLRSATREHHARLERVLDIPGSIGSEADYTRLLVRMYGFYTPLERRLRTFDDALREHGVRVRPRLKARKLELDLHAFGWTPDAVSTLPLCAELPCVSTDAHALGCLYVMEGSTLGGQIISRRIRQVLEIDGDAGLAFFRAYGAHTGRMWQGFVEGLNAYPATEAEAAQATQSARDTFAAMERWLLQSTPGVATQLTHCAASRSHST
jgi:heme oxygenase (biliverdin-IX-beta and delta-forming)